MESASVRGKSGPEGGWSPPRPRAPVPAVPPGCPARCGVGVLRGGSRASGPRAGREPAWRFAFPRLRLLKHAGLAAVCELPGVHRGPLKCDALTEEGRYFGASCCRCRFC